jgi:hypothetical protein
MKNPYARKENNKLPIMGKEDEFFKWAREQELERRKSLPPEEVKNLEEAEQALAKRMNS